MFEKSSNVEMFVVTNNQTIKLSNNQNVSGD